MLNIERFIADHVICRSYSLFFEDIKAHRTQLENKINGKKVLVIGGAGSIGSQYIKALLQFCPGQLCVIDLDENGLAELTRDLRSRNGMYVPEDYRTYTLNFADPIFERIFRENQGFDIVANFSAHKHVRSEKDKYSVQALIENNVIKSKRLLDLLAEIPPQHFFCVSTDKAANPVNVMGASKRLMEDLIMAYSHLFPITTARFANVAFSNGSLPASWINRMMKKQPLVAPSDVKRYFVSPEESGQICMLACMLGKSGDIFFPKLDEEQMRTFSDICDAFIQIAGYEKLECKSEEEARAYAEKMPQSNKYYPVFYSESNTTGEKDYEEFFVAGEDIDMNRFISLGVIKNSRSKTIGEMNIFLNQLSQLFLRPNFTKADIIDIMQSVIPNFKHEEKGKNLDQKM